MRARQLFTIVLIMSIPSACGVPVDQAGSSSSNSTTTAVITPVEPSETSQPAQQIDPALLDTRWTLIELNGTPPIAGSNITLQIETGNMGGYGGCNWYGIQNIIANEGRLNLSEIGQTARDCPDQPGVVQQQETYNQILQEVSSYSIRDDRLEFQNAAGDARLVYALRPRYAMNPADLVGTEWMLESLNGEPVLPNSRITMSFAAGEARGSAGCRNYTVTYIAEGDEISFPSTSMVEDSCMKPYSYWVQEGRFTDSFTGATDYRLSADRLEITNVEGVLVFVRLQPSAAPTPTVWTLQRFEQNGIVMPVLPNTTITISFDGDTVRSEGRINGSSGCNTYATTYRSLNELTVATPETTEMACEEPQGIMEQERRYLQWLRDVTVYSHTIEPAELQLLTVDDRMLVFVAAP